MKRPSYRAADEHFIDGGSVYCPVRQRDVDVDLCVDCQWLKSIDLRATLPVVRCQPERQPIWLFRPWL